MNFKIKLIVLFINTIVFSVHANFSINIDTTAKDNIIFEDNSIGLNFGLIYPIIEFKYDTINQSSNDSVSDKFVKNIVENNFSKFRFPAGTFSQFYHFNGKPGYGYDLNELICRPGTLDDSLIYERFIIDSNYSRNHAEFLVELNDKFKNNTGKDLEIVYVANLLSHFNLNHFDRYNNGIEVYIRTGMASITPFLDIDFTAIDSNDLGRIAQRMVTLINSGTSDNFINLIKNDTLFKKQINENLNCINYLRQNGIQIKKVELGNEIYTNLEVYDDDCDQIGFDCTLPDSLAFVYNRGKLSIYSFCEGVYKYFLLSKIYSSLLDTLSTELQIGLTASSVNNVMLYNLDSTVSVRNVFSNIEKQTLIWNKVLALSTYADAAIIHQYMQRMPICEVLQIGADPILLGTIAKEFIEYYTDSLLPSELDNYLATIPNKKLWITEWNIGGANIIANSFAHNVYIHRALSTFYDYKKTHKAFEDLTYHNVVASTNQQFSLFDAKVDSITKIYHIQKNDIFYGYNNLFKQYSRNNKVKVSSQDLPKELKFDVFYDKNRDIYNLVFLNYTGIEIPLDVKEIKKNDNFSNASVTHYEMMNANAWCSSNRAFCDTSLCETTDSIQFWRENDTLVQDVFLLPPFSFGTLQLDFNFLLKYKNYNSIDIKAFPNPTLGMFKVFTNDFSQYQYQICGIDGKIIEWGNFFGNNTVLNIESYPKGIYFLHIIDDKEGTSSTKIIRY
jgi:hypothetical protein